MKAAGGELLLTWNTEHSQNKNFTAMSCKGGGNTLVWYQFLETKFKLVWHPFLFQREG